MLFGPVTNISLSVGSIRLKFRPGVGWSGGAMASLLELLTLRQKRAAEVSAENPVDQKRAKTGGRTNSCETYFFKLLLYCSSVLYCLDLSVAL